MAEIVHSKTFNDLLIGGEDLNTLVSENVTVKK